MEIRIQRNETPREKPDMSQVAFGRAFSDHMFLMDYLPEKGWYDPRIVPYGPLALEPSAAVLHYAMSVFEGMKAYRTAADEIQLFRPDCNIERMNNSAERLGLPQIDPALALEAITALVDVDRDWVPREEGTSLYIRPVLMSVEPDVSLHCYDHCLFMVMLSPVACYYKEGLKPVTIAIENHDARTVRGGTGYAKCGGNYAASQRATKKAEEKGISQVLWLDGVNQKYIEEVGSMNVMFRIDDEIVTPSLEAGTVLPGVTRRSILQLLREEGYKVTERLISVEELGEVSRNGRLKEAWGCGTAAVVSPIGRLIYEGEEILIGGGSIGPLTQKLYKELTDLQWGRSEDKRGWTLTVEKRY